ncbi:hypothetical protein HQ590_01030 [bacterium]|nr:hypothetical protein [bacterium]
MLQHRRTPAVAILVVVLSLGWGILRAGPTPGGVSAGLLAADSGEDPTLAKLEVAIAAAGSTAGDWFAYAETLWGRGQYADTVLACRAVLEREPYHRQARFRCGLALAAAGEAEEFHQYMRELTWSDAKLAVDLFARSEARPYLGDARLRALRREAQSQAMD